MKTKFFFCWVCWLVLYSAQVAIAAPTANVTVLGAERARVLLTRLGFSPVEEEVQRMASMTQIKAVDYLLGHVRTEARTPAPTFSNLPIALPRELKNMSPEQREAERQLEVQRGVELRTWWMSEMLETPSPLTERLTLFWHNHFVSSQQKVKYARLMYEQNVLLRRYAAGNFADLLHAVSKNPAMLIYLDGANNRKEQPNENFAREVMELFTLGEGHYTEQDVQAAARAFTGWSLDPDTRAYEFRVRLHDTGTKTILGRTGPWQGDDVLDILLAQPATAEFIVRKFWREFISPDPDEIEVRRIAKIFRDAKYELKPMLRALFSLPALVAEQNRGALIKSPVELVVGTLRQFEFDYTDPVPFVLVSAQLGQNLFAPPNVKGWPGGEQWINTTTILARKQFLERLFRALEQPNQPAMQTGFEMSSKAAAQQKMQKMQEMLGPDQKIRQLRAGQIGRLRIADAVAQISFNAEEWLKQYGAGIDRVLDVSQRLAIQKVVLPLEPIHPVMSDAVGIAYLRALVMDPIYQLK